MALRMMRPLIRVEAVSRLYESAPEVLSSADDGGGSDQPAYYNAAARIVTGLSPDLLLAHVQRVEHWIGRRRGGRWAARPIDIDIALYEDRVLQTPSLTIPHPRLTERAFVVRPLLDLDPELKLPGTEHRLAALRAASEELTVVAEGDWWREPRAVGVPSVAGAT